MRKFEYKFQGRLVAIVDVGMHDYAIFKTVVDGRFTRGTESDCKALAEAFLLQLKNTNERTVFIRRMYSIRKLS